MKRSLYLVFVVVGALSIGGAAGFFVGHLTNTKPLQELAQARQIRADSIAHVLADSIAANEAWLEAEKAEQVQISRDAKTAFVLKFGDGPQSQEAISLYEQQERDAIAEALPYMIRARRHINWMKQEAAWIESAKQ